MIAYDSVYPLNRATSTVSITMQKNLGVPQFIGGPYQATIDDTYDLGQFVVKVTAQDTTDNVSTITLCVKLFDREVELSKGLWWSSSYGSWMYNYLCNQCLSPLKL